MLLAVEKDKGKAVLDNYFNTLFNTGYVKRPTVKRFLAWLYLMDFVEMVYTCLTDEDYNIINDALICLFSSGCCLLPYDAISENPSDVNISGSIYFGTFNIRETEMRQWRIAENGEFRVTE